MQLESLYAADQMGFPLLSLIIFLPMLAAGGMLLVRQDRHARLLALATGLCELVLTVMATSVYQLATAAMQLLESLPWIPSFSVHYLVGVDGLSVLFLPATALLFASVVVASWTSVWHRTRLYYALLLLLQSATMGVFCALDMILFFIFWVLTLVPIYLLVSLWGIRPERRFAAMRFVLMMLAGSIPLLFAIGLLALNHFNAVGGETAKSLSFDYLRLLATPLPPSLETVVFALLLLGFAVRAPLFPFHSWLSMVALEGPTGVSALLVGLNLGAFGILRFVAPLAPHAFKHYFWVLELLGATGIVYAGLVALNQTNLRRLLAFFSVSHVGLVVVGISTMNPQGMQGAIYQLLNFSTVSAGLFLIAGFLHHRLGSTELNALGGLTRPVPLLSTFFLLLVMAAIGLPGTNGFVAENLLLAGAMQSHPGTGLAALSGVVLNAACLLVFYQRGFMGPVRAAAIERIQDLRWREFLLLSLFGLIVLVSGLVPALIISLSEASAQAWLARLR